MHNAFSEVKRLLHYERRYVQCMDTPAERLKEAREKSGYETAKAAAEAMGVSVSTYVQHENGARGYPSGRAERYATFYHTTPEWLLYGRGKGPDKQSRPAVQGLRPITRTVPVLGVVQAGLWEEVLDDIEPEELLPINLQGFEGAQLFALRVAGTSMNLVYPEGTRVVVCPAAEIGVREGDHVVVRRRRAGLVETTLKEVVQAKDGIELWPRSSDPKFQDPVRFKSAPDSDEGPEIIAVVVSAYTIRPLQNRPLIQL